MLHEVELCKHIVVQDAALSKRSIARCLTLQLAYDKTCKQHGYFLAITKLKSIGKRQVFDHRKWVLFPVTFTCRMFLPVEGETLKGIVYRVLPLGVMIECGPAKFVYLSARKMPGYHLFGGDEPYFQNERLDRIGRGVVVCFKVLDVKCIERISNNNHKIERQFGTIASLETGEPFGPVSLAGYDNHIYE